jgi:hypothetical protein
MGQCQVSISCTEIDEAIDKNAFFSKKYDYPRNSSTIGKTFQLQCFFFFFSFLKA